MAPGEKSNPNDPKGPDLDINEYTTNPITTVGNDIRVFNTTIINRRPLNRENANLIPTGSARNAESKVDITAIRIEVKAMK